MCYRDGAYVFEEEDPQRAAERRDSERAFLASFEENVKALSPRALAFVEPKVRELLVNYLGRYGAETIVLAGRPETVLWSDDARQSQLAASSFGAKRVCTQTVLLSLTEAGLLTKEEYLRAVSKLIGMGFQVVFFDAHCVYECAKLAEYRTGRFPLKQMLDVFRTAASPARDLVRQFLGFFMLLQQEPLLTQQKALVVRSFLDALWRNPATHRMVLALRAMSSTVFGLNVVAESEFKAFFDEWFRLLDRPII